MSIFIIKCILRQCPGRDKVLVKTQMCSTRERLYSLLDPQCSFICSPLIYKPAFPHHPANMDTCKVVETRASGTLEDETILEIVKNGYINQDEGNKVLRKAEVITVLNESL